MQKITGSSSPAAKVDPRQHGDQQPVMTPASRVVAETMRNEAVAFDVTHPTPTPSCTAPRRGGGGRQ